MFREHLLYALRKNKSKISQELDYLSELKTQNVFQPNLMRLRFKIIWWLANHRLLCLAELVATKKPADVDALLATTCDKCNKVVSDIIKEKIASIGEKITIRRFEILEGNNATYIHNGKIGVLLNTDKKDEALMKDICLHIASCAPEFLASEDIPAEVREEEKRIEMGKEDLAKKPENIREKIVEGRLHKILAQKCLLEQGFVKDPSQTVAQLIEGKLNIVKFVRYTLGEGLEKRSENFADEVMSQIKG